MNIKDCLTYFIEVAAFRGAEVEVNLYLERPIPEIVSMAWSISIFSHKEKHLYVNNEIYYADWNSPSLLNFIWGARHRSFWVFKRLVQGKYHLENRTWYHFPFKLFLDTFSKKFSILSWWGFLTQTWKGMYLISWPLPANSEPFPPLFCHNSRKQVTSQSWVATPGTERSTPSLSVAVWPNSKITWERYIYAWEISG